MPIFGFRRRRWRQPSRTCPATPRCAAVTGPIELASPPEAPAGPGLTTLQGRTPQPGGVESE